MKDRPHAQPVINELGLGREGKGNGLSGGEYLPIEGSGLVALGPSGLAEQIDWP